MDIWVVLGGCAVVPSAFGLLIRGVNHNSVCVKHHITLLDLSGIASNYLPWAQIVVFSSVWSVLPLNPPFFRFSGILRFQGPKIAYHSVRRSSNIAPKTPGFFFFFLFFPTPGIFSCLRSFVEQVYGPKWRRRAIEVSFANAYSF
jgi:hypothetical protein